MKKILWVCIGVCTFSFGSGLDVSSIASGLVQGIIQASNNPKHVTTTQSRRSTHHKKKRKSSSIPKNCTREKWISQTFNQKVIATNFQGIQVTYGDSGELKIVFSIKNPLPSIFKPGDKVHTRVTFSKGAREVNAELTKDGKSLSVYGIDAIYIANKLKAATYVKVNFPNNEYCTRLKGSSKSIGRVETAAANWVRTRPDALNTARVSRAVMEHKEHAMKVASNQLEFSQVVTGIRPKSNLEKNDRNIYPTKIQYYIPGSEEIGEMWVDWYIDDEKGPLLTLNFIDPKHKYEIKTHVIEVSLLPIEKPCNTNVDKDSGVNTSPSCKIVKDLLRVDQWGRIAKEQELRREFSKRVSFIEGNETTKKSLSVIFKVYENGAVAAQIEQKKFNFPYRFNFTMANALELAKYIETSRKKARKKWMNRTRTKEDLDALFN